LAISSLLIPIALATASCCILFPEAKADNTSWFFPISLLNVAISLFKAASLAFSKFNSLPVNNSASS
jgi:hypothetical protein